MTLLQSLATIVLMTMVAYVIMVNVFESKVLGSTGLVQEPAKPANPAKPPQAEVPQTSVPPVASHVPQAHAQQAPLPSAAYQEQLTGVLPLNHDRFDKPVDFESDVTNLSQIYKNNPELLEKIGLPANLCLM